MSKKSGLGRGLDALIPGSDFLTEQPEAVTGILEVGLGDQVAPNPRQPRSNFDAQKLEELAVSIREHGVLQPLIVTLGDTPDRYILVAGERRLLAARQAGLERIPVLVRGATDQQRLELALIENVQRLDLNPLEEAEAYRQLSEEFQLSHEDIAARVGKSRSAVSNTLRLLKLPEAAQQALMDGRITEGHARALLMLPTPQAQLAALHTILTHDLTVRQAESLARKLGGEKPIPAAPPVQPPEIQDLQTRLQASLGTRVRLASGRKGGTLTIHYYSDEELNALVDRILREE